MTISESIRKSHLNLSRFSLEFIEFVREHPAALRSTEYPMLELNDQLFKLQPWPTFIGPDAREEMRTASIEVFKLIKSIPARIFNNDLEKISTYYEISPGLARYILLAASDRDISQMISRGDFVLSADGLKCLEYNVNTSLGGLQISNWESLYLNTPILEDFLNRYSIRIRNRNLITSMLEHLLDAALTGFIGTDEEINIAVVIANLKEGQTRSHLESYYNSLYEGLWEKRADFSGGRVVVCEFQQMQVEKGMIRYNGLRIHTILEWYKGFVPTEIMEVCRNGRVAVVNGPLTSILSAKSNFALLSELEDSDVFSAAERDTIKKYIPWTRIVTPGETTYRSHKIRLEKFICREREKLVLKPLLSYGGKDIHIGRYCPAEKWAAVVDTALRGDNWQGLQVSSGPVTFESWDALNQGVMSSPKWLVQEYAESESYLYQLGEDGCAEHSAIWGYFVFGDMYAGGWVRVLPRKHDRGVINCHQGARVSVVFEVDE